MIVKIIESGDEQIVLIPKEFEFDVDVVELFKNGDELILKPKASQSISRQASVNSQDSNQV